MVAVLKITIPVIVIYLTIIHQSQADTKSPHHQLFLEGWEVYVEKSLVDANDPRVFRALRVLSRKLQEVKQLVPRTHVKQLLQVPIWIVKDKRNNSVGEFYFSERYVYRNDINPEKLDGVEFHINRLLQYIKYKPMLIIHELAHAFHKRNYKEIDKQIMRAYRNARDNKLYLEVDKIAYARKNAFEYFAELSESYFGENDFFPFNRRQLRQYDPMGYQMVKDIWSVK